MRTRQLEDIPEVRRYARVALFRDSLRFVFSVDGGLCQRHHPPCENLFAVRAKAGVGWPQSVHMTMLSVTGLCIDRQCYPRTQAQDQVGALIEQKRNTILVRSEES